MGPRGVLTKKKDVAVIKWTLDMQECGLSVSLQQLKMIVAKLTQTKDTSFQDGIPNNNWWYLVGVKFKLLQNISHYCNTIFAFS